MCKLHFLHLCLVTFKSASKLTKCDVVNKSVLTLILNHQAGSFQNLQTLVEVSSILAAQGVYTNPEPAGSEKPEAAVRQTILGEHPVQHPVQQQQQTYHQPPQSATW